ncbi:MAG: transcriptional regulator [Prevotella sp.]|nr:transcriptional regulator [Prevotella sp.]MBR1506155.1 transcriptional regulator [Prevotella sp.]
MSPFKFAVINPLLHSELRLKIMVALDSLESADFMYLCQITDSTRGNLSIQLTTLKDADYINVSKTGIGRFSRTTCSITNKGREALRAYEQGLRHLFSNKVPAQESALPSSEKSAV